jgi:lipoprotein-anchoring transpeptidase ErfK/SrfK
MRTLAQQHSNGLRTPAFAAALVVAALALLLLIPAARGSSSAVSWTAPTPSDQTNFTVRVGRSPVRFSLVATTSTSGSVVHISAENVPAGATFNTADGNPAKGTFSWAPRSVGKYTLRFTATGAGGASAPARTYVVLARAAPFPRTTVLTDKKTANWAVVLRKAPVLAQPKVGARVVTRLTTWTTDQTQNIVLVLARRTVAPGQSRNNVRLPILPNNSTGWVKAGYLGALWAVHTHLYVSTEAMTATLKRDDKVIFRTRVGVGRPQWPTPHGEFYVRDKLTRFSNPFYGPIAFGTSARSAVLTDWPGGGFVGVHGTNEPGILPGRVSHGCIRLRNAAILRLAQLMPVGTPLTIT